MWHRIETILPNVSRTYRTRTHTRTHTKYVYNTYQIYDLNAEQFYFIDYIWFFLDSLCFRFCELLKVCVCVRVKESEAITASLYATKCLPSCSNIGCVKRCVKIISVVTPRQFVVCIVLLSALLLSCISSTISTVVYTFSIYFCYMQFNLLTWKNTKEILSYEIETCL